MIARTGGWLQGLRWDLTAVWLLVVVSVVSWRQGVIFSGGLDPFVIGKATVAVLGLAGAVRLWRHSTERRPVGAFLLILVSVLVSVSLLGAQVGGSSGPALVLVVRIAMLAATVTLIVAARPAHEILTALLTVMGAIAIVAAVTGLGSLLQEGRLDGGAPALAANELATVALPPAIGAIHVMARRGIGLVVGGGFVTLAGIVVLTGSRTALLVLGIGILLVFAITRPLSRGMVVGGLLTIPVLYALVAFTDTASNLASRGEDPAKLLTLNSRTFAWDAVLSLPQDSWAWWIGQGLQLKTIAVSGQYWTEQVLDSSWISALAQTGVVGTSLLAVLVVAVVVFAVRRPGMRGLTVPLLVVVLVRSFLENGLFESSVTFTILLTVGLLSDPATSRPAPVRALVEGSRQRVLEVPSAWLRGGAPPFARSAR